jgi:hypothetical protein
MRVGVRIGVRRRYWSDVVWRVRRELHTMGYTWTMGWKPDEATRQRLYSSDVRQESRYWG